ncbi:MAG: cation:proton antiporter [bacterium]
MRRFFALIVVVVLMLIALSSPAVITFPKARTTLAFGFMLLAAYLSGDALAHLKMPKITGYILAGIIFGPYVLNFVSRDTVTDLKLIDDLALTFIALAAGGELRLKDLKARQKSIILTVLFLSGIVFLGVSTFVFFARPLMPFLEGKSLVNVIAVAAIVGTFAVARSPSSAIAIISETKARGPFTEMVLGVTVLMDVGVIAFFAIVVSLCQAAVSGAGMDFRLIFTMILEIAISIAAGVLLGVLMGQYIKRVKAELMVFILGVAFLTTFGSKQLAIYLHDSHGIAFHLHSMLICITAGFLVQNFSPNGELFMEKVDHSSLPIYVIFFALVGADLNISALEATWLIALLIVGARISLIWTGAYLGGRLSGDPRVMCHWSGPSFITQAGVSLGLAGIVKARFPDWGTAVSTMIVAVITLNQVIGPVTFKLALNAVGETRDSRSR